MIDTRWNPPTDWPGSPDHADCDCPLNAEAPCARCGDTLADHRRADDPDAGPTPADVCTPAYILSFGRVHRTFLPESDADLDCPYQAECGICSALVCSEHSDEFVSCDNGGLHHRDCSAYCPTCTGVAAEDAAAERAQGRRKRRRSW